MYNKTLTILIFLPLILSSCGTNNGVIGKKFAYSSYSATYENDYTEETFFVGLTWAYENMADFVNKATTFYCSNTNGLTKDGLLTFSNEPGLDGSTYNGRIINSYLVNYEKISESQVSERCSYFVDNGNIKFIEVRFGSVEFSDYIIKGYKTSPSFGTSEYSYQDTSMKIIDNKLIMQLSLNVKLIDNNNIEINKKANIEITWLQKQN